MAGTVPRTSEHPRPRALCGHRARPARGCTKRAAAEAEGRAASLAAPTRLFELGPQPSGLHNWSSSCIFKMQDWLIDFIAGK